MKNPATRARSGSSVTVVPSNNGRSSRVQPRSWAAIMTAVSTAVASRPNNAHPAQSIALPPQELGTRRRVVTEKPSDRARDGLGASALHTAQGHAEMLGLQHDADTAWCERVGQRIRDLLRQLLLGLEPAREVLDDSRKLRETDDAVSGDIRDMCHANEWQKMMGAQRVERNVARDHHLVVSAVVGKRREDERRRREGLCEGGSHPLGCIDQVRRRRVLAERDEQVRNGPRRGVEVDRVLLREDTQVRYCVALIVESRGSIEHVLLLGR